MVGVKVTQTKRASLKGLAVGFVVFWAAVTSVSGDEPTPIGSLDLLWQPVEPYSAAQTPKPVSGATPEIIVEPDRLVRPVRPRIPEPVARAIEVDLHPGGSNVSSGSKTYIRGIASWYCSVEKPICHYRYPPGSMVAAACGKLRRAMGGNADRFWRGKTVTVQYGKRHVEVVLVDWCGSGTKTIDLYEKPMSLLGGTGVLSVTIKW